MKRCCAGDGILGLIATPIIHSSTPMYVHCVIRGDTLATILYHTNPYMCKDTAIPWPEWGPGNVIWWHSLQYSSSISGNTYVLLDSNHRIMFTDYTDQPSTNLNQLFLPPVKLGKFPYDFVALVPGRMFGFHVCVLKLWLALRRMLIF
jgi:hypothetical protein